MGKKKKFKKLNYRLTGMKTVFFVKRFRETRTRQIVNTRDSHFHPEKKGKKKKYDTTVITKRDSLDNY